jgi:putative peptide zinc metalloprotease protein
VAQAIRQAVNAPGTFLLMFAMVVLSAAFHEIGHATGCRYGGGEPGKMGCGLYLAWPAFYTDVTDAYRLGKRGRLRTDLGGVYFNVVVILATVGVYFATHFEALLLLVVIQHFEIVHQLLPIVRLDGYYIVADFTGVPDLFTRIKPIFTSLIPGRPPDERVKVLKPWVRVAVTVWVLVVVPLLVLQLLMILIHLPRILATAWDSGRKLASAVPAGFRSGDLLKGVSSALQLVLLALPMAGIVLMVVRVAQRAVAWMWARTEGKPVQRGASMLALAGVAALLGLAWIPKDNYQPIHRGERGTLGEGISAVRRLPTGHAPLVSEQRAAQQGRLGPAGPDAGSSSTVTTVRLPPTTSPTPTTAARAPATAPSPGARAGQTATTRPRSSATTAVPGAPPTTRSRTPATTGATSPP